MRILIVKFCMIVGLIYVVDSNDRSRFDTARQELLRVLEADEMRAVPVVVLANKQDLPGENQNVSPWKYYMSILYFHGFTMYCFSLHMKMNQ